MGLRVVAIACDWGAGQPGGAAGVYSWYALGLHYKHLAWVEAEHVWLSPETSSPVWIETGSHIYARRLDHWLPFAQKVQQTVADLPLDRRVLFLTGDHSWAGCILPVLAQRVGRLGVVWIDAHADFHNPATSPSGNLHGMSLAMATGLNTERFHPVPSFTWNAWEKLVQPVLSPQNIIFVGLRSYEPPELDLIQKNAIPHFFAMDIAKEGTQPIADAIKALITRVDALYISLDVDVWDPSFARGTGTPAPGGLSIAQVRLLLQDLLLHEKVRFVEVTEINPLLDRDNQTALFAYGTVRPFIDGDLNGGRLSLE